MGKIIEAKAVISAADKTGNVFDQIAAKLKGVEKTAKSLGDIKTPKFAGNMYEELHRLNLSEKELQGVRKSFAAFHDQLKQAQPRFSNYTRAIEEWQGRTVDHWREVKAGVEGTHKAHRAYFDDLRRMAVHAVGIGGAAYLGERVVHEVARQAGDRGRELTRYDLGGISPEERAAAEAKAGEISSKYPSISRTEALGHIRQLRGRLGSFDEALANVDTIAKAQVVLGSLGQGDNAGEDLEKLVLGLESQGLGTNPGKFRDYTDAFVKAKSLFPDLRGEDFRQYMKASNSSKYGLSDEYLKTIAPTMMQHEGASNFGVMQASAFSALIGKRQTPAAQAKMRSLGLLDGGNNLQDAARFIENPYGWAIERLAPSLEKAGVEMDEAHRSKLVQATTQMFSNRKVGEFFASLLVNRPVIEKDRAFLANAKGTEGAAVARNQDPYIAWTGLETQMRDFGAALVSTKPFIDAMNAGADAFSKRIEAVNKGDWRKLLPEDDQRTLDWFFPGQRARAQHQIDDANSWLSRHDDQSGASRAWRMKRFDAEQRIFNDDLNQDMPPIFTNSELERMRRNYVPLPMADPRRSSDGSRIPLPMERPGAADQGMPPVQSLDVGPQNVSVQIQGEAKNQIEVTVKPSAYFEAAMAKLDSVIKLVGSSLGNGPGSTGASSPDAAAPSKPLTGTVFPGGTSRP